MPDCCTSSLASVLVVGVVLLSVASLAINAQREDDNKKVEYTGYKVFRLLPQTEAQLDRLARMSESIELDPNTIQFWTQPIRVNGSVDVMVAPTLRRSFLELSDGLGIASEVLIDDVGTTIKQTSGGLPRARQLHDGFSTDTDGSTNGTLRDLARLYDDPLSAEEFFTSYQSYSTIESKLEQLAASDKRVQVYTIGKSTEGRNMYLVKVSSDPNANKPIILIDAGHHAREWISHATGLYLLESLINPNMPQAPLLRRRRFRLAERQMRLNLDSFDFWFVPAVNPDGYAYSHQTDRLWRKTRSGNRVCNGVDPNRNYPFHWGEAGASPYRCDETYAGPKPLSEPETAAVAQIMDDNKGRIKAYLSLHAYGQYILVPYGYARVKPDNYDELSRVSDAWISSVARFRGTRYTFGTSSVVLYPAAGGSDDYAHGPANIRYAFTIELPDSGRRGFLLPPREIIPVGQETLIGMHALIAKIQEIEGAGRIGSDDDDDVDKELPTTSSDSSENSIDNQSADDVQ